MPIPTAAIAWPGRLPFPRWRGPHLENGPIAGSLFSGHPATGACKRGDMNLDTGVHAPDRPDAMKSYRRILVPVLAGQAIAPLARRATALAGPGSEVRAVAIIDTASGFEPDGPAAATAAERAARRRPAVQRRLELELAGGPLAGSAVQVLAGDPGRLLQALLRDWRPDLVVVREGFLPQNWLPGPCAGTPRPDVLKIARPPRLARILGLVLPRAAEQG